MFAVQHASLTKKLIQFDGAGAVKLLKAVVWGKCKYQEQFEF